ncbi:MAG: SufB/SufD family protein [Candidatus Methanodesulfokora sp.]
MQKSYLMSILDKKAPYGIDIDVKKFIPAEALKLDEERLKEIGIDPDYSGPGTYYQVDSSVVKRASNVSGLKVTSFEELNDPELSWKLISPDQDKYTAAAALYGKGGYVVVVDEGVKVEKPVQTCLFMSAPGSLQAPHNIIIAKDNSEVSVFTGCTIMKEVVGLHVGITEFYVGRNARVNFLMIHSWNPDAHVRPRTAAIVEEGGQFVYHYVNISPVSSLQTYPKVRLVGRNARAHLSSVIVGKGNSNVDVGSEVSLEAPGTRAEIISRNVAMDRSTIFARARIIARAEGRGHTECMGLMLSEEANIVTIPELESSVKEAELTHEAAVGKLKEEEIYYLTSKGIERRDAISMLVRGFMRVDVELPPVLRKQVEFATAMAAGL